MVIVGSAAPPFQCSAVVTRQLVRLGWPQVHGNRTLVLLFDVLDGSPGSARRLAALCSALECLECHRARAAVVCRNNVAETLTWADGPRRDGGAGQLAFPLIVDPDS